MHCQWQKKQNCPFPLWFRHPAGRGLSHGHRQHAHKLVKIAHVVLVISWRTDRHTDVLITILRHRSCGWSNNSHVSAYRWRTKRVVERRIEQKRFQLMTKCIDTTTTTTTTLVPQNAARWHQTSRTSQILHSQRGHIIDLPASFSGKFTM